MSYRLALPKKGRLREAFEGCLAQAGLEFAAAGERLDYGALKDAAGELPAGEVLLQRPQDALDNITLGILDGAIVGSDTYEEARSRAEAEGLPFPGQLCAAFGRACCTLCIAVPNDSAIAGPQDLEGLRIATSYPATLRRWLEDNDVAGVKIIAREGGIEDYVRLGVADAVCDIVESGGTLKANGLERRIDLMPVSAVMVTRANSPAVGMLQQLAVRMGGKIAEAPATERQKGRAAETTALAFA